MEMVRHIALGCCVLSTVAGVIRIFWPENGFAPVINAVLVLYIITAGLQMLRGTDWQGLTAQLYALSDVAPLQSDEYAEYSRQVARTASAEAVRQALAQAQIEAVVTMEDQGCQVELLHKEDRSRAEAVLAASCGELEYSFATGGETP